MQFILFVLEIIDDFIRLIFYLIFVKLPILIEIYTLINSKNSFFELYIFFNVSILKLHIRVLIF